MRRMSKMSARIFDQTTEEEVIIPLYFVFASSSFSQNQSHRDVQFNTLAYFALSLALIR